MGVDLLHATTAPDAMATIYDIARRAGTSPSTVSRVLNGSVLVASAPRERILEAAEALGYRPRNVRRPLSRSVFNVMLIIRSGSTAKDHLFYDLTELIRGLEEGLGEMQSNLVVATATASLPPALEKKKLGDLDAMVFAFVDPTATLLSVADDRAIPVVAINRNPGGHDCLCGTVMADDTTAARDLVSHVVRTGLPNRVLFVGSAAAATVSRRRQEAFAEAWARLDAQVEISALEGIKALSTWIAVHTPAGGRTVVHCVNDLVAAEVCRVVETAGLAVPDDVAITGFDNVPALRFMRPRPTTVDYSVRSMGRRGGEILAERLLRRGVADPEPRHVLIPGRLLKGETT